ncbi:unnamed protein product [Gordionus sp. m RMFG-2023]
MGELNPYQTTHLVERVVYKSTPLSSRSKLSIPPSSASSERVWSAFGKIHSKTRNRIKNERVEKLISIRHNIHLKDHTNTSSSGYHQKSSDSDLSISSDNDDISISSHEDIDAISLASQEF